MKDSIRVSIGSIILVLMLLVAICNLRVVLEILGVIALIGIIAAYFGQKFEIYIENDEDNEMEDIQHYVYDEHDTDR